MGTLVLAGRYEIIEKIGDGGMAVVYKARDRQLNRFVAIKILKKEFIADQTFVENFIREAKAAASLLHPNIVTIHDAGKDRDIYYIVMEYIEGKPLSDVIAAEAPLDYKRCIRIAKQVASALSLAHRNNIIHRDVKPHNILITADGTAKITDFGIAKAVSDGTIINDSGVIMGSVHYFSPEQSRGQYVDEKSDIYSLGIVLYEMITGRVPFDADNPVTIAVMHMNDTIIPPSKLVKGVPPGLDQIVMKATAKYQSDRFGNIDEMYKALDNVNFITGIIEDPEIAGFVAPTNIKREESPGQGYSSAAEPGDTPFKEELFDDYADAEEPEYRSSRNASKQNDFFGEDDDDYEDEDEAPALFAAKKNGRKAAEKDNVRDIRKDDKRRNGEQKKGKMDKKQKMILIIAVVAIAIVLSIPLSRLIISMFDYEPVIVPDVVGLYFDEASDILTEAGFNVDVTTVPLPPVQTSSALPAASDELTGISESDLQDPEYTSNGEPAFREGQVMEQDPAGGESVRPGITVKLKVAGPPANAPEDDPDALGPPAEVPDLKGKTKSSAEYAIDAAGFQIGGVTYENSDLPIDTVISQSPNAGEMAPSNSRIHIVISLGPKEELVTVPDLRGRTEAEAQTTVTQLGLQFATRDVDITDVTQNGRVLEQNPAPNSSVSKGSTVTVDIGVSRFTITMDGGTASVTSARPGDRVDIVANPDPAGKVFESWSLSNSPVFALNPGGMTQRQAFFLMPEGNVSIRANFVTPAPTLYTLTVSGGSGSGQYAAGQVINISASGAGDPSNPTFLGWGSTGGVFGDPSQPNTTFTMPASNVTVTSNGWGP